MPTSSLVLSYHGMYSMIGRSNTSPPKECCGIPAEGFIANVLGYLRVAEGSFFGISKNFIAVSMVL